MPIYKANTTRNFTTLFNHTIQDTSLTFEASGLLHLLLSMPSDWEIKKSWLQIQKKKCGRDKLTRMIKELIDTGYVIKKTKHDEAGKLTGVNWYVFPTPQTDATVELKNRPTEKPSDGKTATTKETDKQTIQGDKIDIPILKKTFYSNAFLELWELKPPREGSNRKNAAFKAYRASIRRGNTHEDIKEGLLRYREYCRQTNKINTSYVMSMARFFGVDEEFKNQWEVSDESKTNTANKLSTPTIERIRESREQYFSENP